MLYGCIYIYLYSLTYLKLVKISVHQILDEIIANMIKLGIKLDNKNPFMFGLGISYVLILLAVLIYQF